MPATRHAARPALFATAPPGAATRVPAPADTSGAGPADTSGRGLASPALAAIVVLGCQVRLDSAERLSPGALARRVEMGARTYHRLGDARTVIVVSGGRRWGDDVEADAMAQELAVRGVPERAIVRERCSLSTRENAQFSAEVLARRGTHRAALVTCPWHMARAVAFFSRAGLAVDPYAAPEGGASWPSRVWRWGVERVLTLA